METSDGKFIVGQVKEKSEAEVVFTTALQHGQTAGVVNWAGDDGNEHRDTIVSRCLMGASVHHVSW